MNSLLAVLFLAAAIYALVALLASRPRGHQLTALANVFEGTHQGAVSKLTDSALTVRDLLVKFGSDSDHIAINTDGDIPLGVCNDEATAAEERRNVLLLGVHESTIIMIASEVIAVGAAVYTEDGGKIQNLPGDAGTYYHIGYALNAAAGDDSDVEVQHMAPVAVVIS